MIPMTDGSRTCPRRTPLEHSLVRAAHTVEPVKRYLLAETEVHLTGRNLGALEAPHAHPRINGPKLPCPALVCFAPDEQEEA